MTERGGVMLTTSQDKYDAEMRDIGKEISELEARAGIAEDTKNAREDSFLPATYSVTLRYSPRPVFTKEKRTSPANVLL
jgi:hypothetical protein